MPETNLQDYIVDMLEQLVVMARRAKRDQLASRIATIVAAERSGIGASGAEPRIKRGPEARN